MLKEGVGETHANKERSPACCASPPPRPIPPAQIVPWDHIGRMKEGQEKKIITSPPTAFNAAKNSPHLEIFRKKGIEVLLLSDRVDEWVVGHLTEFDGQAPAVGGQGRSDLGKLEDEAEKQDAEKAADEYKELIEKVKSLPLGTG